MSDSFYITTAIPYANGAPHIGHAYERIATDAIQRFMRLDGRETLFVTGMDEHGLKMQQTAVREGLTPQALADRTAALFDAMSEALEAAADDIVRTSGARHPPGARDAGELPQRDRRLRQTWPRRSLGQQHDVRLGRAGARRPQARHVF